MVNNILSEWSHVNVIAHGSNRPPMSYIIYIKKGKYVTVSCCIHIHGLAQYLSDVCRVNARLVHPELIFARDRKPDGLTRCSH